VERRDVPAAAAKNEEKDESRSLRIFEKPALTRHKKVEISLNSNPTKAIGGRD